VTTGIEKGGEVGVRKGGHSGEGQNKSKGLGKGLSCRKKKSNEQKKEKV